MTYPLPITRWVNGLSAQVLEVVLQLLPVGVFLLDAEGKVVFANPAAEKITGWKATDAEGQILPFIAGEKLAVFRALLLEILNGAANCQEESTGLRKNGDLFPASVNLAMVSLGPDSPPLILVVIADISQQKLMQANFLRSQRMESLGQLAGGIALDLNNLFTPLLMGIQSLHMSVYDTEGLNILKNVASSAQKGARAVQQLLTFSGGIETEHGPIGIATLLHETALLVRQTFPKTIAIQAESAPDLWIVKGDAPQLQQVLMNLCLHGRDAMRNGGQLTFFADNAQLDASYANMNHEAKPGAYIVITVSDTGSGVAQSLVDRLFDPLFSSNTREKSTSLGMAAAREIVKNHGGFIHTQSQVGKGTEFKIYLPAMVDQSPRKNPIMPVARGNGELILVVEDEPTVQMITCKTLEGNGYRVLTANDGAEGLAVYTQNKNQVNAVLTDMVMPFMNGPATIRALRKMNACVPIIATSGMASQKNDLEAVSSQIQAFLPKPFTADQLLTTVSSVLVTDGRPL